MEMMEQTHYTQKKRGIAGSHRGGNVHFHEVELQQQSVSLYYYFQFLFAVSEIRCQKLDLETRET